MAKSKDWSRTKARISAKIAKVKPKPKGKGKEKATPKHKVPVNPTATIELHNHKSKLITDDATMSYVRKSLRTKFKNAYFMGAYADSHFDGYKYHITEAGYFASGFLSDLLAVLADLEAIVDIKDKRPLVIAPTEVSDKGMLGGFSLREYQSKAIKHVIDNDEYGITFPRGILKLATNAGKTIFSAGVYLTYGMKTLILVNSKDLFEEALLELPSYLGASVVGKVNAKIIDFKPVTVAMVQTLVRRVEDRKVREKLKEYHVLIVDECDLSTNKTYTKVLSHLTHSFVRLGISGTPLMSKDPVKNKQTIGFFGKLLGEVSSQFLISEGYSSKVDIRILDAPAPNSVPRVFKDWKDEYDTCIISNTERNNKIVRRLRKFGKKRYFPALCVCRYKDHVHILYELAVKKLGSRYTIDWIHSDRPDIERVEVVRAFREGEIDILIGSYVLARGKNFKKMKYLINAGGLDSSSTALQILGRALRKGVEGFDKPKVVEDFYDHGEYITRHSRNRIAAYEGDGYTLDKRYVQVRPPVSTKYPKKHTIKK